MAYAKINSVTNANMAKVSNVAKAAIGKIGSIDAPATTTPFTFVIDTSKTGIASYGFQLPLIDDGTINFTIDWGDGNTDTITAYDQAETLHNYAASTTYTVQMTGTIRGWNFGWSNNNSQRITNISQWGDMHITNGYRVFANCYNLTCTATDAPTVSATNFQDGFRNSGIGGSFLELVQLGSAWDVSTVTTFYRCFSGDEYLNDADFSNWTFRDVTNISQMFVNCAFNQDVSSWDVSNVTNVSNMFANNVEFDQDLSAWDLTSCTDFTNFLEDCTLSTANYDATLIAWAARDMQNSEAVHFGSSTYTEGGDAAAARQSLIDDDSWTITDGGTA